MRALSLLAAAAMVVSLFLPWISAAGLGVSFVPFDLVRGLEPDVQAVQEFVTSAPPLLLAFLASFVLAALFVLLSVLGLPSRLLALLGGGIAVGTLGYGFWQAREGALSTGLPVPTTNDLSEIAQAAMDVMGLGAWAWVAGAVLLLLAGLIGFGSRR